MMDMPPSMEPLAHQLGEKELWILSNLVHNVKPLTPLKTTMEVHNPMFPIKGTRPVTQIKKIAND